MTYLIPALLILLALILLGLGLWLRAYLRRPRVWVSPARPICGHCFDARMAYTAQHDILKCPRCGATLDNRSGHLTAPITLPYNLPE